jgi:hypothetical protein
MADDKAATNSVASTAGNYLASHLTNPSPDTWRAGTANIAPATHSAYAQIVWFDAAGAAYVACEGTDNRATGYFARCEGRTLTAGTYWYKIRFTPGWFQLG